jgi:hypothetical protein
MSLSRIKLWAGRLLWLYPAKMILSMRQSEDRSVVDVLELSICYNVNLADLLPLGSLQFVR